MLAIWHSRHMSVELRADNLIPDDARALASRRLLYGATTLALVVVLGLGLVDAVGELVPGIQRARKVLHLLSLLLLLGAVGWLMKVTHFPRAPFLIGFVLSIPLERYAQGCPRCGTSPCTCPFVP